MLHIYDNSYIMFAERRRNDAEEVIWMDYQKLYTKMFNAATDALHALEQQNIGTAKEILQRAQQEAEELYLSFEE